MKKWLLVALVVALVLFTLSFSALISGCNREAIIISLTETDLVATPAGEGNDLKIAVSAMISPKETFKYYRLILDYVSLKLDTEVKLVQRKNYAEVNRLLKKRVFNKLCHS